MTVEQNYNRWINSPKVPEAMKEVLRNMTDAQKDDAFFKDAEFGTGGLRGILGPGTNRLNEFTIRKVNVAYAKFLLEKYPDAKEKGVVISHDNRHKSREFTLATAKTLNEFGIKAYIFDSLRPTPELSFAVRYLKCCGGVMITASHNPKEYNGYKAYDDTGCQLVPDTIARLLEIIKELPNELEIEYEPAKVLGETIVLDHNIDDEYVKNVESIAINRDLKKDGFKIVFTPNHGASYVNSMRIFKDLGYDVTPVLSQCEPDSDFSGTLSPNPEDQRSYIEPVKLAKQINADLVVMTDPDGDRVGLAYLASDGSYQTFTGNQAAAILMDYIFSQRQEKGLLHKNGAMYNTVVTSSLGEKIATSYGVKTEQFLTGFKYIGDRIGYYEKVGGPFFEFGYEESYGCLVSDFARDKDACQAILLYCEMALFYHLKGKRLDVVWDDLSKRFGYHVDVNYSIAFTGSEGMANMNALMGKLHDGAVKEIDGVKVVKVDDFLKQKTFEGDKVSDVNLPVSDVVKLYFEDGNTIAVRPSGTEPKVKFYIGVVSNDKEKASALAPALYDKIKSKLGL